MITNISLQNLSLIYIFVWCFALSLPWVYKACKQAKLTWRIGAWVLLASALFALGYFLDQETMVKPHQAYQSGTFYLTYVLMSILITTPSVIYFRAKQQQK